MPCNSHRLFIVVINVVSMDGSCCDVQLKQSRFTTSGNIPNNDRRWDCKRNKWIVLGREEKIDYTSIILFVLFCCFLYLAVSSLSHAVPYYELVATVVEVVCPLFCRYCGCLVIIISTFRSFSIVVDRRLFLNAKRCQRCVRCVDCGAGGGEPQLSSSIKDETII